MAIGQKVPVLSHRATGACAAPLLATSRNNEDVDIGQHRFEKLVADSLDSLPESLGRLMENVAVTVEDWPTSEQLAGRRGTLLGLYQGTALTKRSPLSYGGVMPDRITIFRGPISQLARSDEELAD